MYYIYFTYNLSLFTKAKSSQTANRSQIFIVYLFYMIIINPGFLILWFCYMIYKTN